MDKNNYGETKKYIPPPDTSTPVNKSEILRLQQILDTLLYYDRMLDPTILVSINELSTKQTKSTTLTLKNINQLLDYYSNHPNSTIRYTKSNMILKIHSDSGYLNVNGSKIRSGVIFI